MAERRARARRRTARGRRHRRLGLCLAAGIAGAGWWVSGALDYGPAFSRLPTTLHLPEFVVVWTAIVIACWGALLLIGEVTLFALAVHHASDQRLYDLYRNLMILWGYVLTLGCPSLFRRLPAQFASLFGAEEDAAEPRPRVTDGEEELRMVLDFLIRNAGRDNGDDGEVYERGA